MTTTDWFISENTGRPIHRNDLKACGSCRGTCEDWLGNPCAHCGAIGLTEGEDAGTTTHDYRVRRVRPMTGPPQPAA